MHEGKPQLESFQHEDSSFKVHKFEVPRYFKKPAEVAKYPPVLAAMDEDADMDSVTESIDSQNGSADGESQTDSESGPEKSRAGKKKNKRKGNLLKVLDQQLPARLNLS